MPCKIDTGAQVNVISMTSFNNIVNKPALRSTSVVVKPYGMKQTLKPLGSASLQLGYKGRRSDAEFIVINTSDPILLVFETCLGLGIVHIDTVDVMTSDSNKLIEEFADVFEGLGCVPGEYDIKIDPSVPPVIQPTRKVPLNLRPKLWQVLNEMERRGVIVKRTEPTDWVSALLLIEKKNGSLWVCMDPIPLNKVGYRTWPTRSGHCVNCCETMSIGTGHMSMTRQCVKSKLNSRLRRCCVILTPVSKQ
jgi:hypothetical protein